MNSLVAKNYTINLIHTDPEHSFGHLDDNDPKPRVVIIRELDYRIDPNPDGNLEFYYSRFKKDQTVNNVGELNDLLKAISMADYPFDGGPSFPKQPFSTKLSLNSKDDYCYVVIRLSDRGWRFSGTRAPFKIGTPGACSNAYYDATCVNERVAYFISDGQKARVHEGGDYAHAFNIHVELDVASGGPMPIRIDPDVRHPGGSGE